jgi:NAD(P)-dependent dehydrogenase (short-subunit alcohol dehydrogenase family)
VRSSSSPTSTRTAPSRLTVSLARELAADEIRVNGIAPGFVESDAAREGLSEEHRRRVMAGQTIQRVGRVGDAVSTALFLCSDEASFVNGQTWIVDGGWTFRL